MFWEDVTWLQDFLLLKEFCEVVLGLKKMAKSLLLWVYSIIHLGTKGSHDEANVTF